MKNLCSIRFLSSFPPLSYFFHSNYNENTLILYNLAKHSKHKEAYMKKDEGEHVFSSFCDIPVFFKHKKLTCMMNRERVCIMKQFTKFQQIKGWNIVFSRLNEGRN